jgi:hypothetical protein
MQDRNQQLDENLLQRTAGPYIRVKRRKSRIEYKWSGLAQRADLIADVLNWQQRANNGP